MSTSTAASSTTTQTSGDRLRRVLTACGLLAMVLAILAVFAPTPAAYASCKPGGIPSAAGSGVAGLFDGPTKDPSGGNNYGKYGWAGLRWYTCDLGFTGDIPATIDTTIGNGLMGLAVWEGAAINGMHKWTADPTATLKPIDDKISQLSEVTKKLIFDQWAYPVIVFAAVTLVMAAITRKVRQALVTALVTLLALGFVALISGYPLQVAQATDGVASSIVSGADAATLKVASVPTKKDGEDKDGDIYANASEATGAVLNDAILAPMWRLGETGTMRWSGTTQALFTASSASYKEVKDTVDAGQKQNHYNDAVNDAKRKHPEQYSSIKGQGGNRTGAGLMALVLMSSVAAIRIPAEGLIFLGLLVFRFIPIVGYIFALMALTEQTRAGAMAGLKMVAAAVFNVVVFGVIAALETAVVALLFVNSNNIFVNLVISVIVTYLLLRIAKPFKSVTRLATGNAVAESIAGAPEAPGGAVKKGIGFLGSTASSFVGNTLSRSHDERKQKREEEKSQRTIQPESVHPGPEVSPGTQVHPDWQNAPQINPAWADAPDRDAPPAFTPENKWTGLNLTSPDWDEPLYTPDTTSGDAPFMEASIDVSGPIVPDRPNALIEPEWDESGRMIDTIFMPPMEDRTSTTINNEYTAGTELSAQEFFAANHDSADQIIPEGDE